MTGLVDLLVLLVVALAVLGVVRRGAGLLPAAASGAGALLAAWLVAAVVLTTGPGPWHRAVADSGFVQVLRPPVRAVEQLTDLVLSGPG